VTDVRVVHDDHGSHWPMCLESVAPHKLCVLPRDHKGAHLPLPKIPESGAA
jgi:hypothetical protein